MILHSLIAFSSVKSVSRSSGSCSLGLLVPTTIRSLIKESLSGPKLQYLALYFNSVTNMSKVQSWVVILNMYCSYVAFFRGTKYVSSSVRILWTVLCLIFAGTFGSVVRTHLAFIPRRLWMVTICMSSSFSCRLLDIQYNFPASFHSFHTPERLRLSISNSEGDLMHSMS